MIVSLKFTLLPLFWPCTHHATFWYWFGFPTRLSYWEENALTSWHKYSGLLGSYISHCKLINWHYALWISLLWIWLVWLDLLRFNHLGWVSEPEKPEDQTLNYPDLTRYSHPIWPCLKQPAVFTVLFLCWGRVRVGGESPALRIVPCINILIG